MKKVACLMFLVPCFLLLSACSKGVSLNSGDVVASVNGVNITAGELDKAAEGQLQRVDQEIYQIKRGVLDDMVQNKLVEQAAKKQGKSVDDYLKENIDSKIAPPTDDEVKSFYEARKDQMGGKKMEEVKDNIIGYLMQGRTQGIKQQLFGGLRAAADIKVNLDVPRIKVEAGDAPSIGPKNAKVTIIEFTDYQCPFCARVRGTISKVLEDYKDKVRYVLRDFPLSFHEFAKKAHEAAQCAGDQDKYWDYNNLLWANQGDLQPDKLKGYAKTAGLDVAKFDKCLSGGKFASVVEKNAAYGASVGVSGTPAFFINGISLSGNRSYQDFKDIIDDELKK